MEIQLGSADFSSPIRGSGPRKASTTFVFPRQINVATAGLTGYWVGFEPRDDHWVGRVVIMLEREIKGNTIIVTATLGLRDWSGDWDDNYQGRIDFVVLADLMPITAPPPRADLQITGMEINQAVQFFRANTYLDAATAQPDNAITPIARKETGVRVYVDYDASAGLPRIDNMTGQLIVRTPSTTLTLSPINKGGVGTIVPRPDSAINMAIADHTLNFDIPAVWCSGEVELSCQVWDAANPTAKSAVFSRTVVFTAVRPLNIFTVGIGNNAVTPVVNAPTLNQILTQSLPQLIKTYPIGDIIVTGYTTMNFNQPIGGNLNNGCGSYSTVLDRLSDLRGGSDDIYLGIVNDAVPQPAGNSVGGCGGSGLAATFLSLPADVPHEVGHALGRRHAPCTPPGRCKIPPTDVDPNYPQYASFPSDSIGVYGFDPTAAVNPVFSPANTYDFMAYSFQQWVSAYTYAAIGGAFGAVGGPGPGAMGGAGPHQLPDAKPELLLLALTITRDRKVTRIPSFHHVMAPTSRGSCSGQFTAELLDADKNVLACAPLNCDCDQGGGCDCWPKHTRDAIAWPEGARWLFVWEGNNKIYEEAIPNPPKVEIVSADVARDGVHLQWKAQARKAELWYLVHWLDERSGQWRGVAPRQQEQKLVVPIKLVRAARGGGLDLRVLATSGIATGVAEITVGGRGGEGGGQGEGGPPGGFGDVDATVVLIEDPAKAGTHVLRAIALDSLGRQLPSDWLHWYDAYGAELGRGPTLDTRTLPSGRQVVRAVFNDPSARTIAATGWLVEPGGAGAVVHHTIVDKSRKAHTRPPRKR